MENGPYWQTNTVSHHSGSCASPTYSVDTVMDLLGKHPTIWVFGYGSLLWKPDFRYKSKRIGYIEGYERRFYQGNVTFRGKPGQPGRVANLVENKESQTWGVAYEISGQEDVTHALQALYTREATCGGYVTQITTFYPRKEHNHTRTVLADKASRSNLYSNNGFQEHSHSAYIDQQLDQKDGKSAIPNISTDHVFSYFHDSIDESSSDEEQSLDIETTRDRQVNASSFTDSFYAEKENNELLHYFSGCSKISKNSQMSHETVKTVEDSNFDCFSSSPSKSSRIGASGDHSKSSQFPPVQVLLYTATSDNDMYLGPDDMANMARQIVSASGSAGSNVEYITKIADYVRKYIPEDVDDHLFTLNAKVREEVYRLQAIDSTRLQLGLADLSRDLQELDHEIKAEPVLAS